MSTASNVRALKGSLVTAASNRPGRATGPRSEAGKFRSAMNSLKHGLGAVHALLPGEDGEEYTRLMDGVFEALAPANAMEAEMVALVGDDLWRLERLARIEQGITLARIEELAAQVGE